MSLCHLQCGTPQVNWALPKGRGHLLRTCPMPAPFQPHSHHSLSAGLPGPPITPTYQEETQTMEVSRSYHVFNSCLFSICQAPPYPGYWHCLTHPAPARLSDELGENHAHFTDKGMETLRPQTTESGRGSVGIGQYPETQPGPRSSRVRQACWGTRVSRGCPVGRLSEPVVFLLPSLGLTPCPC